MAYLFAGLAALWAVLLLLRRRRELRRCEALADSVAGRQLHLHEEQRGSRTSDAWALLAAAYNRFLEEHRAWRRGFEAMERRLESTLEAQPEPVLVLDGADRILAANGAARELFGGAGEGEGAPLAGRQVRRVLAHPGFYSFLADLRSGRPCGRREFEFALPQGALSLVIGGTLLPDAPPLPPAAPAVPPRGLGQGGEGAVLLILTNVTRERRLEGIQKDFVANVSHELRTPLSVIRGYAETLAEDSERMEVEERRRFLDAIHRHSIRLGTLVEDLLTISRLDSRFPGLQIEPVDLHELLRRLGEDFGIRAARTGHDFREEFGFAGPAWVRADESRLAQVFENLFDNAQKYSPRGSAIRVRTTRVAGDGLEVAIADDGPGIPEKDLPRIFERFYRVEKGRSREKGGTGLGLSIVQQIVHLHRGRVWAENGPAGGAVFRVLLPEAQERPPTARPGGEA